MANRTRLAKARKASGLTAEKAGKAIGMSGVSYYNYEKDPSKLTFKQFFALVSEMDEDSKPLMAGVLDEVEESRMAQVPEPLRKPLMDMTLGEYFDTRAAPGSEKSGKELAQMLRSVFG